MGNQKGFISNYDEKFNKDQFEQNKLIEGNKEKFKLFIKILIILFLIKYISKYILMNYNLDAFIDSSLVSLIINIINQLIFIVEIFFLGFLNYFLQRYFKYKKNISKIKKICISIMGNLLFIGIFFLIDFFIFSNYVINPKIFNSISTNLFLFLNQIHYLIYLINYNLILFLSSFIFLYFFLKNIKIRLFFGLLINFTLFYLILNNFSIFEIFELHLYLISYFLLILNLILFIFNIKYSKKSFNVNEFRVDDFYIILKGENNKKRIMSFLEIEEIPKNFSVREIRETPRLIDKLNIRRIKQYTFYHLLALAEELDQIAFEILITDNSIKLRFVLSIITKENEKILKEKMIDKIEFFKSVYISSFPGIKFKVMRNNELKDAWKEVIYYNSNNNLKWVDKNIIEISKESKEYKKYLSILKISSSICLKAEDPLTQIDQLINNLLSNKIKSRTITVLKPYIKHDFDENFNKFGPYILQDQNKTALFDNELQEKVKKLSQYLRHKESLQLWTTSIYQIIESKNVNDLRIKIKKAKAFLISIFSDSFKKIEIDFIKRRNLKSTLVNVLMRDPINELILSSDQAIGVFHLPEKITPSIITNFKIPNFDLPPKTDQKQNQIPIGEVLYQDLPLFPAFIDIEELRLNTFITGLIGMGKTEFSKNILINLSKNFPKINWMVLEWKGDYSNLIYQIDEPILVLPIGNDHLNFKINLFEPKKSNPENHANKIFSIFKESLKSSMKSEMSSYELSPQMEKITKEVLIECIKNKQKRSFTCFFQELKNYEKAFSSNNKSISMTIAAIENRFNKFVNGSLRNILNVQKSNVNFHDLMNYKVVFDFSHVILKEGSKEEAILLMNIILKYVMDEALNRGPINELKHIVVIEDAQYLVPSILRELPETTLGEDIPLLLRGVGESMISIATRPEISQDIIANSALKISFRLTTGQDTSKVSGYQNLNELHEKYLKILPKRECIVTTLNFPFPFRIKTLNISQKKASIKEIFSYNYENFLNFNFFNINENDENNDVTYKERISNSIKKKDDLEALIEYIKYEAKTLVEIKNKFKNNNIEENLEKLFRKNIIKREIFPIFESNMARSSIKFFIIEEYSLKNIIIKKLNKNNIIQKKYIKLDDGEDFNYIYENLVAIKIFEMFNVKNRDLEILEKAKEFIELTQKYKYEKIIVILPLYEDLINFNDQITNLQEIEIFAFYFNYKQWNLLNKLIMNISKN
ncbi:MAG: hypothetical protein EAX96_09825 [Candidatus Lokiarchaeota archaeon]|nr:hypothetical protein [Candidatus Lokiarchaeota archaeon]